MDEVKEISFYPNNSKSIFRCRIKVYEDNKLKVYDIPYIQFNKDSSISIIKQDDKDTGVFDKNNKIHKNCIFSRVIRRLNLNLSGEMLAADFNVDKDNQNIGGEWFYEVSEESLDEHSGSTGTKVR